MVALNAAFQDAVQQFDVLLERNALADLVQVLAAATAELRIVQQQVGELRSLLHQVEVRHASRFALEFLGGNAEQFAEHVAGVVEAECLVEIAGE